MSATVFTASGTVGNQILPWLHPPSQVMSLVSHPGMSSYSACLQFPISFLRAVWSLAVHRVNGYYVDEQSVFTITGLSDGLRLATGGVRGLSSTASGIMGAAFNTFEVKRVTRESFDVPAKLVVVLTC